MFPLDCVSFGGERYYGLEVQPMADINKAFLFGHTTPLHCNGLLSWRGFVWYHQEGGDQGLDEVAVKFYLAEITLGLNDLHVLGLVHCDMKPENILISQSGHVRLVNFGVAAQGENGKVVSTNISCTQSYYHNVCTLFGYLYLCVLQYKIPNILCIS